MTKKCLIVQVPDTKHKRGRFDLIAPTLIHALAEHSKAQLKGLKGADRSVAETIVERTSAAAAESTRDSGSDAKGRKRATTERVPIDTTLSGLGIVVPYDKKTEVGWRELSVSDSELQRYVINNSPLWVSCTIIFSIFTSASLCTYVTTS